MRTTRGYSTVDMAIVLAVVGILAGVAVPSIRGARDVAKIASTKHSLDLIRRAIVGGESKSGYRADTGDLPAQLADLTARPDDVPEWNRWRGHGWNGPYLDPSALTDAWGRALRYEPAAGKVSSSGADGVLDTDDDISVEF